MNKQERMIAGGFFSCGLQFTANYCTVLPTDTLVKKKGKRGMTFK